MSANFNFSKRFAPEVASRLNKADDYLYTLQDPVASVESAGTAMEQLVRHILIKEGFAETDFSLFIDGINYLERKYVCPRKIIQKINRIRKARNQAAHTNQVTAYEAKIVLKNAYKILKWCVEEYQLGTAPDYIEPNPRIPMLCIEGVFRPLTSNYAIAQ